MIYTLEGEGSTKNIPVSAQERADFILNDEEIIQLAQWGIKIEDHYSKKAGVYRPMDIEWARMALPRDSLFFKHGPRR